MNRTATEGRMPTSTFPNVRLRKLSRGRGQANRFAEVFRLGSLARDDRKRKNGRTEEWPSRNDGGLQAKRFFGRASLPPNDRGRAGLGPKITCAMTPPLADAMRFRLTRFVREAAAAEVFESLDGVRSDVARSPSSSNGTSWKDGRPLTVTTIGSSSSQQNRFAEVPRLGGLARDDKKRIAVAQAVVVANRWWYASDRDSSAAQACLRMTGAGLALARKLLTRCRRGQPTRGGLYGHAPFAKPSLQNFPKARMMFNQAVDQFVIFVQRDQLKRWSAVDRHHYGLIVTELAVAAQFGFGFTQWNDFHEQ